MLADFDKIILPLFTALGLSLVVERIIEFLRNILTYFSLPDNVPAVINRNETNKRLSELNSITASGIYSAQTEYAAEELANSLDQQLASKDYAAVETTKKALLQYQRDREWNEAVPVNVVSWQSATGPRGERVYNEIAIHTKFKY